ncbi:hypothetical protein VA7868_03559 [Vibrio aerogenes CECT 7868]|uniref:Uncharacterized protein n=1 Tax=Vibrio aerogenes CECT 7868 TaxID=1216006 RepID=A0A1M6AEN2_9VIBR|nr:hypothetical protein [Vibrio aerogenes]SHI34990.1 hypothetical protein VA7868_03559 [Vibrio aerogenes CECT 7868]
MDLEELTFWFEVVQRTSVPDNGNQLTSEEKAALVQSCQVLAQIAQLFADQIAGHTSDLQFR